METPAPTNAVPRPVRRVRNGLVAATLAVTLGPTAAALVAAPEIPTVDLATTEQADLTERNRCAPRGFATDRRVRMAVVRREGGRPRLVALTPRWRSELRERPGRLVALCLGPRGEGPRGGAD